MDYAPIIKDARANHDAVKEVLVSAFEDASPEDRKAFQDDARRILLPYDLIIGLALLKEAVLSPTDRRNHIHFIVKYGACAFDILRFAESYAEKKGLDFPVDEKALRNLNGINAENFIATLKEPIDRLFAPVLEFLRKYDWKGERNEEFKKLQDAVLNIGADFLASGKGEDEDESERLTTSLRAMAIKPLLG